MRPDLALHITWTCYATWLPGDERGHVSNVLLQERGFETKQNVPGSPISAGDAFTRQRVRSLQNSDAIWLTPVQALCAATALVQAADQRRWHIRRAALMSNHVHVVIMNCPDDGPLVRRALKGCSQAALSRAAGRSQRWWTAGGSDRYKHGTEAIEAAVLYVADQKHKLAEIIDMQPYALVS
jgi:REP element-mobilizing transposase RayT